MQLSKVYFPDFLLKFLRISAVKKALSPMLKMRLQFLCNFIDIRIFSIEWSIVEPCELTLWFTVYGLAVSSLEFRYGNNFSRDDF